MRARILMAVVAGGLFWCFTVSAEETEQPKIGGLDVKDALAEPANPDDKADIKADHDPNDVGQKGLEPSEDTSPVDAPRPDGGDTEKD